MAEERLTNLAQFHWDIAKLLELGVEESFIAEQDHARAGERPCQGPSLPERKVFQKRSLTICAFPRYNGAV
jgi:hypothetical protein